MPKLIGSILYNSKCEAERKIEIEKRRAGGCGKKESKTETNNHYPCGPSIDSLLLVFSVVEVPPNTDFNGLIHSGICGTSPGREVLHCVSNRLDLLQH